MALLSAWLDYRNKEGAFVAPMSPCGPQPAGRNCTSGGLSMGGVPQNGASCHACVVHMHERWRLQSILGATLKPFTMTITTTWRRSVRTFSCQSFRT
eukprot:360675-Chlamydomonas_euryale.AAC.2